MSSGILQDDRVKWIRQKVVLALEITTDSFDNYFQESLDRARSAGVAREQLTQYLSDKYGAGSALFFAAHNWAEDVEGEHLAIAAAFCYEPYFVFFILQSKRKRKLMWNQNLQKIQMVKTKRVVKKNRLLTLSKLLHLLVRRGNLESKAFLTLRPLVVMVSL